MNMKPFVLERFFAKHEFTAKWLACCSDCEPLHMNEVLELASPKVKARFNTLRLAYTETQGLPELRQAVAEQFFTECKAEDLVVLVPEEGVYLSMRALLQPGDHVIAPYPGYQSLYEIASSMGCSMTYWEPEVSAANASVRFNITTLLGLIHGNTKMVVINFPHNPTGTLLTSSELQQLVDACVTKNCWLFSDEMYRTIELDPQTRVPSAADLYSRAISLGGCSKSLSLPGLRLGWIATRDAAFKKHVLELKDYTTICSAAPSEMLALMAVQASSTIIQRNLDVIKSNIQAFQQLVDEFPHLLAWIPPEAGSTAYPRLLTGENIEAFCDRLVADTGVLLLPSTVYDHAPSVAQGHFRLGLGRKNLPECLNHLREYLQTLPAGENGKAQ